MFKKFLEKKILSFRKAGSSSGCGCDVSSEAMARYSKQLENSSDRLRQVIEKKKTLHDIFADCDDDFWFWLFTDAYDNHEIVRQVLPGMPEDKIAINFTGRSGRSTLAQAFSFYKLSKNIFLKNSENMEHFTSILDFGCGWGRITRFFLKDIDSSGLWGVDCVAEVINSCKNQNIDCNFELIKTMPPIRFETGTFDFIFLFSVFSHLSEEAHLAWLKEFNRILKPGGMVIATTRPRSFIHHCNEISKKRAADLEDFEKGAALSFSNPKMALEDYDNGKFVHSPTGGGDILSTSFFGETCIPKEYVERTWSKIFSGVGFIFEEEHGSFDQNVIFAIK